MTVPSSLRVLEVASPLLAAVVDEPLPGPGTATRVVTAAAPGVATGRDVRVLGLSARSWLVLVEAVDVDVVAAAVARAGAPVRNVSAGWSLATRPGDGAAFALDPGPAPRWLVAVGQPAADASGPAERSPR